jgi:hypothetical protein
VDFIRVVLAHEQSRAAVVIREVSFMKREDMMVPCIAGDTQQIIIVFGRDHVTPF